jgi:hypothetical protein
MWPTITRVTRESHLKHVLSGSLPTSTVQKNWAAPLRFRMYTEFRAWAMDNELKQHLVWVCHGLSTYLSSYLAIYLPIHLSIHPSTYLSTSIYHYLPNSLSRRRNIKKPTRTQNAYIIWCNYGTCIASKTHNNQTQQTHIYSHIQLHEGFTMIIENMFYRLSCWLML